MAKHEDDISAICPSKEYWKIVVKVIRMWKTQGFNGSKLPFSLEMVLLDAKGSKIQASIRKTLIYKFDSLLTEGHIYCLSYFGVGENVGSYRYTKHTYKLNFQYNTKVVEIKDFPIDLLPFSFVPLSDIMFNDHNSDFLVDVIRILTGVGSEREYEKDGKKQKLLTIEIDGDGVRLECAFFGNYVDEVSGYLSSGDMTNAVVVIQYAKVKIFKGKPSLQNVYGATKIVFNPDIEEASRIKEKFFEIYDHGSQTLSQLHEPERMSIEDDFLNATVGKTIEDVKDLRERSICVILGTIKHIPSERGWCYTACKCNKKVIPDEDMYYCEGCNRHIVTVYPRYRIQIRVIDENDSVSLVIFDQEASMLLEKSCADLLDSNDQVTLPAEIVNLLDKTFLFKIEVNNSNTSKFEPSYRVKRICTDPDIINRFKAKHTLQSITTPEMSLTTPTSDYRIEGVGSTLSSKDLLNDFVDNKETTDNEAALSLDPCDEGCSEEGGVMKSATMPNKKFARIKKEE